MRCGIELKGLTRSCSELSICFVAPVLSSGMLRLEQKHGVNALTNMILHVVSISFQLGICSDAIHLATAMCLNFGSLGAWLTLVPIP